MTMTPQLPLDAPVPRGYIRGGSILERIMYRTSLNPETGCWLWRGSVDRAGYGSIGAGGDKGPILKTHRAAYEALVGPIPAGLTIDHLCSVKACVNPAHLEAVPLSENIRRAWAIRRASGRCVNDHPMRPENTATGKNRCRECARARNRAYKARLRGAA